MKPVTLAARSSVLILLATTCLARPVAIPATSELWQKAELVAVIRPQRTERNDDRLTHAGPKYGPRDPGNYQGLNTVCTIESVLKKAGAASTFSADELTLLHFAYSAGALEFNGALFIYFQLPPSAFVTGPDQNAPRESVVPGVVEPGQTPTYLAFLRQREDGRFEPATGNYDAAPSFRLLTVPTTGQLSFATQGIPGQADKREGPATVLSEDDQYAMELGRNVLEINHALQHPEEPESLDLVRKLGLDTRHYVMVRGWILQHISMAESYRGVTTYTESEPYRQKVEDRIKALQHMLRAIDLE